jgi:hypothetical protein
MAIRRPWLEQAWRVVFRAECKLHSFTQGGGVSEDGPHLRNRSLIRGSMIRRRSLIRRHSLMRRSLIRVSHQAPHVLYEVPVRAARRR